MAGRDDADVLTIMPLNVVDTVLLKVSSRCNLDCGYCYIYQMGDDGWRHQPKRMSDEVEAAVVHQLSNLYAYQQYRLHVVLHGGEPLLIGPKRMLRLCGMLRSVLPEPCEVHVQTNGVLLTEEFIDVFVRFNVGISISIDGPPEVHNQYRVDRRGRGSYEHVQNAIALLTSRNDARHLFTGVLAVVDPGSDAYSVYRALKATGTPSIDFLVRDGNHTNLPDGKASVASTEYGSWMIEALDVYLSDPNPPRVRIFDDMLRLILGGRSNKEGVGTTDYGIVVIDTDGSIVKNDTLKVAHNGADRFDRAKWTVLSDNLVDVVRTPDYSTYYTQQRPTASKCLDCPELHVCGGGMVAHRWSDDREYDNPTIYCADQLMLISRMKEWIFHHKYRVRQSKEIYHD